MPIWICIGQKALSVFLGFALLFQWPCSFCQKASAVVKCGETILKNSCVSMHTNQCHPGWNFHYKKGGVDVSTNPKKMLGLFQYHILEISFRRNQTPFFTWNTLVFFAAWKKQPRKKPRVLSKQPNQQNQLCSDLKRYRGTSRPIKRRVCGCPWSIRGKNWWGGKGPQGMEGPDEIINPMNTPEN